MLCLERIWHSRFQHKNTFPGNNEALTQGEGPVHQLTSSNRNPSLDAGQHSHGSWMTDADPVILASEKIEVGLASNWVSNYEKCKHVSSTEATASCSVENLLVWCSYKETVKRHFTIQHLKTQLYVFIYYTALHHMNAYKFWMLKKSAWFALAHHTKYDVNFIAFLLQTTICK